jgi:V8-like Glu-specific endopeptidase
MRWVGLVLGSAALAACAAPPPAQTTEAIIGGQPDFGHPEVVLVEWPGHLCTGTLITSKLVLTAAHCVVAEPGGAAETPTAVYFGHDIGSMERAIPATRAVYQPDYGNFEHDIAVVVLAERSDVTPARVNFETLAPGAVGLPIVLVGFGKTGTGDGAKAGEKQSVAVPLTEVDEQVVLYPRSVCDGDSGGPGFMSRADGSTFIVGVTSYGDACETYGASQRTDVHRDWIRAMMATLDPPACDRDGWCLLGCPMGDADCPCAADGVCATLCPDPDDDPDCPKGCGAEGTCVAGCPAPDPDCGDPCGAEGHCVEECKGRDPDCPAPLELGAACQRDFDCRDAVCWRGECSARCPNGACVAGFHCRPTRSFAVCEQADLRDAGGCAVGGGGWGGLALVLVLLAGLRRRALVAGMLLLAVGGEARAEAPIVRGTEAFRARRYAEAAAAFRAAPEDPEAMYRLGVALVAAGDTAGAIDAWERALLLAPEHGRARRNLELFRARAVASEDDAARVTRARALLGRGRAASAAALLEDVDAPEAALLRAEARLAVGEDPSGDAALALAAAPVGPRPLRALADAAALAGETDRARRLYELYVGRFGGEPDARGVRRWLEKPTAGPAEED